MCLRHAASMAMTAISLLGAVFAFTSGDPAHAWLLPVGAVAAGLFLFVRGFLLLQRKRLIQNTPTSKIRSAALGLVEVSGLAVGPYTLTAPITGVPCYCYRTMAWQEKQSGKNKNWEIVAEENLHVPFFLDDNTGKLLIDPRGAELDLHRDFRDEFSDSMLSFDRPIPDSVRTFLTRHNVSSHQKTRVEEYCIKPKNFLFILGTLAENPGITVGPSPIPNGGSHTLAWTASALSNPISFAMRQMPLAGPVGTVPWQATTPHASIATAPHASIVNLSAGQSAPSSAAQMTQQGKIAAALQKAGIANPAAWAAAGVPFQPSAVQTAVAGPESKPGPNGITPTTQSVPEFDFKPPVVLMKGENNPSFLISWRNERELLSSMGWKSTAMIWGGPALTLVGLYLLAARFGWL